MDGREPQADPMRRVMFELADDGDEGPGCLGSGLSSAGATRVVIVEREDGDEGDGGSCGGGGGKVARSFASPLPGPMMSIDFNASFCESDLNLLASKVPKIVPVAIAEAVNGFDAAGVSSLEASKMATVLVIS
ncbi:hypothetical protein Salat_0014700 [Sesamum alatum]|uniref:Uncharacterized protein n=1 Tax=Sesamum alatum TaxID=300844 RepID=A0AAE1YVF4_9LAMI|nr:hypothetical protein Salat_0014700 [Sesamum alatum]